MSELSRYVLYYYRNYINISVAYTAAAGHGAAVRPQSSHPAVRAAWTTGV